MLRKVDYNLSPEEER